MTQGEAKTSLVRESQHYLKRQISTTKTDQKSTVIEEFSQFSSRLIESNLFFIL
jgi:hypothetical protein